MSIFIVMFCVVILLFMPNAGCGTVRDFHNLGYALQSFGQIRFATADAKMFFTYRLPNIPDVDRVETNCSDYYDNSTMHEGCLNIQALLHTFVTNERLVLLHMREQMTDIFNVVKEFRTFNTSRHRRGLLSRALSSITGLASEDEVQSLQALVDRIEAGVLKASNAWSTGTRKILSSYRITQRRFYSLHRMLLVQGNALNTVKNDILRLYIETRGNARKFLPKLFRQSAKNMIQLSDLDHLYHAINLLSTGKISHYLLGHRQLYTSLLHLSHYIRTDHGGMTLVHTDVAWYYRHASVNFFRAGENLVIMLTVPLVHGSINHVFDIYKIIKIPLMPVTKPFDHVTVLDNHDLWGLVDSPSSRYYVELSDMAEVAGQNTIDLRNTELMLRVKSKPTCGLSLLEGRIDFIKEFCGYTVSTHSPRATAYRIGQGMVILNQVSRVVLNCRNDTHVVNKVFNESLQNVSQLAITVPCACTLLADEIFIPEIRDDCSFLTDLAENVEMKFIINLPFLSEFYTKQDLEVFDYDQFLNDTVNVKLPSLSIESSEFQGLLAREEDYKYDMAKLINSSKADVKAYASLSHYVYNALLKAHTSDRSFDLMNAFDWLLIIALVVAFIAIVLACMLRHKLKSLYLLLGRFPFAAAQNLPKLEIGSDEKAGPVTHLDYEQFHEMIQKYISVDLTVLICVLVILIGLAINVYRKHRRRNQRRTVIQVEVGDTNKSYVFTLYELALNAHFYAYNVDKSAFKLTVQPRLLGSALIIGDCLRIANKPLSLVIPLPMEIGIYWPWTKIIQEFLRGAYYTSINIVAANGELVDVILLKELALDVSTPIATFSRRGDSRISILESAPTKSVYPSLA